MRIGVYICHCGKNIAGVIDVEEVARFAAKIPGVITAKDYRYMCSDPGQEMVKADIEAFKLDRIVIASCSPNMHQSSFMNTVKKAGMNPYRLERANIRENVSWVNSDGTAATEKAKILVAAAVAKVMQDAQLIPGQVPVTPAAVVAGAGIAGMQAALDIADAGFRVYLVEKEKTPGGHAACIFKTFPDMMSGEELIRQKTEKIKNSRNITLLTESTISSVSGYTGNFDVAVTSAAGEKQTIRTGALILATGYSLFNPSAKPELGYGKYPEVITGMEFEALAKEAGEKGFTVNGKQPRNIVFIQCVGSRDKTVGADFCSRVCCMASAKQALAAREALPDARITVCYIDVRAFGRGHEEFYEKVQRNRIIYRRGNVSEIYRKDGRLMIKAEDTLLDEIYEEPADLVVLAAGMRPSEEAGRTARLLNISTGADGFFLEAHPKLGPVETTTDGIFLAGCSAGPKDITDSISQAHAAAIKACIPLFRGMVQREPLVAAIEKETCAGCRLCENICEYRALVYDEKKRIMTVNQALCRGCGACAAACPSGTNQLSNSSKKQIIEMIDILS